MPAATYPTLFFNRGLISPLGLARHDIARGRLSASTMTNWVPRILGSMMIRPGLKYIGGIQSNAAERLIPFIFANDDAALIELTDGIMRVWDDDFPVTRPSPGSAAIANPSFTSNLNSWTDLDDVGGTSVWVSGSHMGLTGNGDVYAARYQDVTISATGVEHTLEVIVERGPVEFRVGSSAAAATTATDLAQDYVVTFLDAGFHHIAFVPTGNIRVSFLSRLKRQIWVNGCTFSAAGAMTVDTRWNAAALDDLRFDQSGDVVYVASNGIVQQRIVRRSFTGATGRSWSVERYAPEDGPFNVINTDESLTITPAALSGNTTLTASKNLFKSTHAPTATAAGALFKIESDGQVVTQSITAQNTFTDAIRVIGAENTRIFTVTIDEDAGGAATFTLQRSLISATGPWTDVFQRTADTTETFDDGLDNQVIWYRLGVKTGDYVNGTHAVTLTYTNGSITGIARVTGYTSPTVVSVEVLKDFGGTSAADSWYEGTWSDFRGWPSAVAFHDGRLGWAGKDKVWLSVTDAFDSFDSLVTGDSGPIARSIGSGAVDQINWMLSLDRLVLGGQSAEWSARSSSLDEPVTPTAFTIKRASTQGSAAVQAVAIDRRGVFVQKCGSRVYELNAAADPQGTDYAAIDLTQIVPEVAEPAVVRIAVQRKPDTRVHCVLSDGTVALLVIDTVENALCWSKVETRDGDTIEDVAVLPGTIEDAVYYVVRRAVGGTVRYLEKWSLESEAQGGAINKVADSHVTYTGSPTTGIGGLGHMEGQQVTVWANGADVGSATFTATSYTQTYTVSSGQIILATAATNVTVGLPYRAQWKSAKLALPAALGTSLTKKKRVHGFGLILYQTHAQGLFFGRDFTHIDPLPTVRNGAPVVAGTILTEADDGAFTFPGDWFTDSRVCLEARSPRPCTVVAAIADTETYEQR